MTNAQYDSLSSWLRSLEPYCPITNVQVVPHLEYGDGTVIVGAQGTPSGSAEVLIHPMGTVVSTTTGERVSV